MLEYLRDGPAESCSCRHTEIEAADQTFHLTRSQYTDTWSTRPSADITLLGAGWGGHCSNNFSVIGITRPTKRSKAKAGIKLTSVALEAVILPLGQRGCAIKRCGMFPSCRLYVPNTQNWSRYHGGRRSSSDDSLHSPTVIPPPALDKPSIMKRYHRRRTTR